MWRSLPRMVVLTSALMLLGGVTVLAQSPVPSAALASTPPAGPVVDEPCGTRAGLLPSTVGTNPLAYEPHTGAAFQAYLDLTPLVSAQGIGLDAACIVTFGYGDPFAQAPMTGVLVRVSGVDEQAFPGASTRFWTDALVSGGKSVTPATEIIGGREVVRLDLSSASSSSSVWVYTFGDSTLMTPSRALVEAVLPSLPALGEAIPSVTAPPRNTAIQFTSGAAELKHSGKHAGKAKRVPLVQGSWNTQNLALVYERGKAGGSGLDVNLGALEGDFSFDEGLGVPELDYHIGQAEGGGVGYPSHCDVHLERTSTGGVTGDFTCDTKGKGHGTGTFWAEP
jgi:hypothetical protein